MGIRSDFQFSYTKRNEIKAGFFAHFYEYQGHDSPEFYRRLKMIPSEEGFKAMLESAYNAGWTDAEEFKRGPEDAMACRDLLTPEEREDMGYPEKEPEAY